MKKALLFLCFSSCSYLCFSQSEQAMNILYSCVQSSCENEVDNANYHHAILQEILIEAQFTKASPFKLDKLQFINARMEKIKDRTHEIIAYLDSLKLSLLEKGGNNVSLSETGGTSVIHRVFDDPCKPISLHMFHLKNEGDDYSFNSREFAKKLTEYRSDLLQLLGSYEVGGKSRYFREFPISKNTLMSNLSRVVQDSLRAQGTLEPGDPIIMGIIYAELTTFQMHGDPLIRGTLRDKLSTIASIQYDILHAYNTTSSHWRSKVSHGDLITTDHKIVVESPSSAKKGETLEVELFLAAYDDINEPIVLIESVKGATNESSDGGTLTFTMGDSDAELSGTIKVMTKMGNYRTYPWATTIPLSD
jgi:hypothetical protein